MDVISEIKLENSGEMAGFMNGRDYVAYFLSSMRMGRDAGKLKLFENMEELIEAYIFNENEAVHIFDFEGTMKAVHYSDGDEKPIRRTQLIRNKKICDGNIRAVVVADYIGYDEYGQAYVKYSRPYKLVREG